MNPPATPESSLPGEELVSAGLADLAAGRQTDSALLVQIAAPRLRSLGISIPGPATALPREHVLYDQLETRLGSAAHSYYNSLIRRIVSFARALEQDQQRRLRSSQAASGPAGPIPSNRD